MKTIDSITILDDEDYAEKITFGRMPCNSDVIITVVNEEHKGERIRSVLVIPTKDLIEFLLTFDDSKE